MPTARLSVVMMVMTAVAVWVVMHVAMMVVTAPGSMNLAVLVVPMPIAVEVPAVGVAMHVAVMVTMPVITWLDVDVLCLMHNAILIRG